MRVKTAAVPVALSLLLGTSLLLSRDATVAEHLAQASHSPIVAVGQHRLPVHAAADLPAAPAIHPALNHDDIPEELRTLWNDTLESLPPACRGELTNVYVQFQRPDDRAYSGKHSIIFYGGFDVSDPTVRDMARSLFVHEFGHITDLGCLQGTAESGPSGFKDGAEVIHSDDPSVGFYSISWTDSHTQRPGSKSDDFVSGYAAFDPFEDFGESYVYFALQEPAFYQRALGNPVLMQKYLWMRQYVFNEGAPNAKGLSIWTGSVPWDITQLPYEWAGGFVTWAPTPAPEELVPAPAVQPTVDPDMVVLSAPKAPTLVVD